MALFGNNKTNIRQTAFSETSQEQDSQETIHDDPFTEQHLNTIRSLILFLKQFALDIEEINSDRYKRDLDQFKKDYLDTDKAAQLDKLLKGQTPRIEKHIQRQFDYLKDREKEFRDIIDLLSKAMTGLNTDNQSFYQRVYDHSEKLEQITLLNDIKKIKNELENEVSQIRKSVSEQKKLGNKQIELLANQVDSLRSELEKTKTQMNTDALTGVMNRSAMDQCIDELFEQSFVHRSSFALMLLDIDNFKQINDTHGHLIGDRVLVAFAQKCRTLIRSDDFIARFGGEEFIILLPKVPLRNARKKARQICKEIAATRYSLDNSDGNLVVTASIGVASMKKGDTVVSMLERADKALYLAKRKGKNCVFTEKDISD